MTSFYFSEKDNTVYIYHSGLLTEKLFDVKKLEKERDRWLVYGLRGDYVAVIYGGEQLEHKIE